MIIIVDVLIENFIKKEGRQQINIGNLTQAPERPLSLSLRTQLATIDA